MFPLLSPKTGMLKEILSLIAANIAPSPPTATMISAFDSSVCPYRLSKLIAAVFAFLFFAILK